MNYHYNDNDSNLTTGGAGSIVTASGLFGFGDMSNSETWYTQGSLILVIPLTTF